MDETMLTLKTAAVLTERDGQAGLTLCGHTRFAKDARQTEILLALVKRPQPIESLMTLLQTQYGLSVHGNDISLVIAEFILDFGEFLEA